MLSCRYAENQDLVNKNAALVQQQAETIAELQSKLEQPGAGAWASSMALQAANKRARELEAELEEVKVKGSLATMQPCCSPVWPGCISLMQGSPPDRAGQRVTGQGPLPSCLLLTSTDDRPTCNLLKRPICWPGSPFCSCQPLTSMMLEVQPELEAVTLRGSLGTSFLL